MNLFKNFKNEKGQALSETILSIPLLFLFAAGTIQFSIVFLSYVQFEHACGEAAREYSAGTVNKNSMGPIILENLGYFTRYFEPKSLTTAIEEPSSKASIALDTSRHFVGMIPGTLNFDGAKWNIKIRCRPPYYFAFLFPKGLVFETAMQVYRYPK